MSIYETLYYTYLIGWSSKNLWYYGVRYSQKSNPNDLWITYFTSSKYVKDMRVLYGEPDIIQIRKTFSCPEKAQRWETKVLTRLDVTNDNKWINRNIGGSWKTTQSIPNILKGKTFEEIYGKEKADQWKYNIGKSSSEWWETSVARERKQQLAITCIQNINFTTAGITPYNKITEKFLLTCEFCEKTIERYKTIENLKIKTCGSKSCAQKWNQKYNHTKVMFIMTCKHCGAQEELIDNVKNKRKRSCVWCNRNRNNSSI